MSERDFCFWLWGFMELNYTDSPTVDQWKCIKSKLASVFSKNYVRTHEGGMPGMPFEPKIFAQGYTSKADFDAALSSIKPRDKHS